MMVDDRAPDRDARPLSGVYDAKDAQEGLLPQAFYVHDAQGNIQVCVCVCVCFNAFVCSWKPTPTKQVLTTSVATCRRGNTTQSF